MSVGQDFSKDVKQGNIVDITIMGTEEIEGTVINLEPGFVKLQKKSKTYFVQIETITKYQIINNQNNKKHNTLQKKSKAKKIKKKLDFEEVISVIYKFHDRFMKDIEQSEIKIRSYQEILDALKFHQDSIVNEITTLTEELDLTFKYSDKIDQNNISEINDIISKLQEIGTSYNKTKLINDIIANVYYKHHQEITAIEYYEKSCNFAAAFLISEQISDKERMLKYALLHLFYDDPLYGNALLYIIEHIITHEDYSMVGTPRNLNYTKDRIESFIIILKAIALHERSNFINHDCPSTFIMLQKKVNDFRRSGIKYSNKTLILIYSNYLFSKQKKEKNDLTNNNSNTKNTTSNSNTKNKTSNNNTKNKTSNNNTKTKTSNDNIKKEFYVKAEKYRNIDKNFKEAEIYYKESINRKQMIGPSVKALCAIFIEEKRYDECVSYLTKYGDNYLSQESYISIKKRLLKKEPIFRTTLERWEHESHTQNTQVQKTNFFINAQKAQLEEKDLQKAIQLYLEAIKQNDKTESSIQNLASIYSRLEMYDEALKILDDKGVKVLSRSGYLNQKLSIYNKAKDIKYLDDFNKTINEIITITNNHEKLYRLLYTNACLMSSMKEYRESSRLFELALKELVNYISIEDINLKNKQLILIFKKISNNSILIDDYDTAKKYAHMILEIDETDSFAISIITQKSQSNIELLDDINDDYIMTGMENNSSNEICLFIRDKIQKLNLESEISSHGLIKDGKFIGSNSKVLDCIRIIRKSKIANTVNNEAKSNQCFAVAKLYHHLMEKDLRENNYETEYLKMIARGCCYYGIYSINNNEIDSARYVLTQTIKIFKQSQVLPVYWYRATINYIRTFFYCDKKHRKSFFESNQKLILQEKNNLDKILIEEIHDLMNNPISRNINDFVIGMINFLVFYPSLKQVIITEIINNALKTPVLIQLMKIAKHDIKEDISLNEFENEWDMITKKISSLRHLFSNLIHETIDKIRYFGELKKQLSQIEEYNLKLLFPTTDLEYLKELFSIFSAIIRYNEISEFDYKSETLRQAEEIRKRLSDKIEEHPTEFSYEILKDELDFLMGRIFQESIALYSNAEPSLTVKLSGDCTLDKESSVISVPIAYINKHNVQNADNVSIQISSTNTTIIDGNKLSKIVLLGNGMPKEELIKFKNNDKINNDRVFGINIRITYEFKKSFKDIVETSKYFVIPVHLYSDLDFKIIENKFEILRDGHPVEDPNLFYGRDNDISEILNQLQNNYGNSARGRSLALYGQTRTGKSSLLYHLEKNIRKIPNQCNIIINLGSIGDLDLSNNILDFLYEIIAELSKEIRINHKDICTKFRENFCFTIDEDILLEDPNLAQLRFNSIFKKLKEYLNILSIKYSIILMIDEFTYIYDWIRQGKINDQIMKFWKAFIQNNGIFAIIIGQDHMMKFVDDERFTNDFGTTDLKKVTYLSEEDAKRLMDEPIQFINDRGVKVSRYKEGALDRLYELTSGSPFLIGQLCAGLVDYMNQTCSIFITRAHIDDYLKQKINTFEESRLFDSQYHDKSDILHEKEVIEQNKLLLRKIAQSSRNREWTPINKVISSDTEMAILKNLEKRDVVEILNNNRCKIKVSLYKEWLIEKFGVI